MQLEDKSNNYVKFKIVGLIVGIIVATIAATLFFVRNKDGLDLGNNGDNNPNSIIGSEEDQAAGSNMTVTEDGGVTYMDKWFEDEIIKPNKDLYEPHLKLAEGAVILYLLAPAGEIEEEVMDKYFTQHAKEVISQLWDYSRIDEDDYMDEEFFKLTTNMDVSVMKSKIEDDRVKVLIKDLHNDSYDVFFEDDKVHHIEYVQSFSDPSKF